jgi:hypothetical protein
MSDDEKKDLTFGERAVNWTKSLGALAVVVGMVLGYLKSDDAQGDVASLISQLDERVAKQEKVINIQSEKLEKLLRTSISLQSHQAGFSAGKLYEQNELLAKRLDRCFAKRIPRSVTAEKLAEILRGKRSKERKIKKPTSTKMQQIPRLPSPPFRKGK